MMVTSPFAKEYARKSKSFPALSYIWATDISSHKFAVLGELQHETFPPGILASSRGRERAPYHIARCVGTNLSEAARIHHHRLPGRWRDRPRRTPDGSLAVGPTWPDLQ